MKRPLLILLSLLFAGIALASGYRFPVGERAIYKVYWGLISCGTSTITCDEVEENGRTLIRIRVEAKSNWLVSTVYPVDDLVECFIDPETQQSIRLEKYTSEGDLICKDLLEINRETNIASWNSESTGISTNYPIDEAACDAVSFLYVFRRFEFEKNQSRDFKMVVDTALHDITVTAGKTDRKKIGDDEKVECREYIVTPKRDDLFVYKVPQEIWITEDDRKIMAKMIMKTPRGKARIVLDSYQAPDARR